MTEIPADVLNAAFEIMERIAKVHPWKHRAVEDIARAILAERERCIRAIVDAANAGKYTPLSELVAAIRGDQ